MFMWWLLNSSLPGQHMLAANACHFADGIFKCNFVNEKFYIQISLKFVPKGPIANEAALVWVMVLCRIGDKPLSEPMLEFC